MNTQYQPNPAYPGFPQATQPPPGLSMMDPNIAQMTQQRYMQQHQQQLAAMHAAGMAGFSNIPGAGLPQQQGMRMPHGMPGMGGMPGMPGPGGPSSHGGQMQHTMHQTPSAPKQKRKPGVSSSFRSQAIRRMKAVLTLDSLNPAVIQRAR